MCRHAQLRGYGMSADAHHITAPPPDGAGAALAMRRALRDGGIAPADVAYVNAHGTGTPLGDVAELRAIARVFGGVPAAGSEAAPAAEDAPAPEVCLQPLRVPATTTHAPCMQGNAQGVVCGNTQARESIGTALGLVRREAA
jgi:hypothetical protein